MERAFQKFQNVTWSKNLDFVFSSFFSWVTSNLKGFLCSENHSTHETEKHFRLEKICFWRYDCTCKVTTWVVWEHLEDIYPEKR